VSGALLYCAGGGIGDSLVASVVARALRSRYTRVDALTLPAHRSTLERVPDIDTVLVDDGDEAVVAAALQERRYAACVVTWATARTARIPQLAKIPVRVGQARRLYSLRFTDRVTVRSETGDVTSPWVDILLDYARALGCDTDDRRPRFVPTHADRAEADRVMSVSRGAAYLILHPTNAVASQRGRWPAAGWAALARRLAEQFDRHVFVSGAAADAGVNQRIVAEAAHERVIDIAGQLGIGGFGALAERASAFVGITTGTMHVAAAAGAPTVGIFPFQTDFPERWGPSGARTAIVRASFPCHPGDTKETCADYACIANLDLPRILAAVSSLLGEAHARDDSTLHV
jgi:heptosyltransferase-2